MVPRLSQKLGVLRVPAAPERRERNEAQTKHENRREPRSGFLGRTPGFAHVRFGSRAEQRMRRLRRQTADRSQTWAFVRGRCYVGAVPLGPAPKQGPCTGAGCTHAERAERMHKRNPSTFRTGSCKESYKDRSTRSIRTLGMLTAYTLRPAAVIHG
ncbi:hypothetical protein SKAU_G00360500 [Synaphobranchus kaupii]|uniref:Uncharacterized protein n=1 Tax=Synaphobranchus kaupii TaxID=118154 RepID=A0A9Q1EI63_SYNKA|nr:hypothetical protein SKAU_G00360500 [Synaphobranchus kaupii]